LSRGVLRIVVSVAVLVLIAAVITSARAATPPLHSAMYRDAHGEAAGAPDITRVAVSDDRRNVTFRVWIANRPDATNDMGLQIVIDSDRRQATGNQMLVYSLGADYLVQMLGGTARLLRWAGASNRWLVTPLQPSWSYISGRATIRLRASALRNPSDFSFEVSVASGLIVDGDGTIDITTAQFDFAPDAGHGGWRYRA
jgi:hypothetical protein